MDIDAGSMIDAPVSDGVKSMFFNVLKKDKPWSREVVATLEPRFSCVFIVRMKKVKRRAEARKSFSLMVEWDLFFFLGVKSILCFMFEFDFAIIFLNYFFPILVVMVDWLML